MGKVNNIPPLREDYDELGKHRHIVYVEEGERRRAFVEMLESHGFGFLQDRREGAIQTHMPMIIDFEKKTIEIIWNIGGAAAVCTMRQMMVEEDFMLRWERDFLKQEG